MTVTPGCRGAPSEILEHPNSADPFGRGKRRYMDGPANIAISEITILTVRLLQDYEISLVDPKATWKPKQSMMRLMADPYPAMNLVPRT